MKSFMVRLSLAVAMTLGVVALSGQARAQDSSVPTASTPQPDPSSQQSPQTPSETPQEPTARPQQDPNEPAANPAQNEAQMPAAGSDAQTQGAKSFSGRIVKENGKVVLKDPVTKASYQINDVSKVKPYMGKQVKVTGKLDLDSNTIKVESIEPLS